MRWLNLQIDKAILDENSTPVHFDLAEAAGIAIDWLLEIVGEMQRKAEALDALRDVKDTIAEHRRVLQKNLDERDTAKKARSSVGRKGSDAKLANDKVQIARSSVKEEWDRLKPSNKAEFARKMQARHPVITSARTIENWVKKWRDTP